MGEGWGEGEIRAPCHCEERQPLMVSLSNHVAIPENLLTPAHGEPVEPRGNLVEVEHVPGNHHCYADEIAALRSQ